MSATGRVFLVRHGESTWNAVRRWQGQADPPLTELGENQARAAASTVSDLATSSGASIDLVLSSQLQRARRTGELLAQGASLPLGDPYPDLQERAAGEWEGLTRVEIEERDPGFLDAELRPPGYEHDESIVERATRALREIAAVHPGSTILIVSHGGLINALERSSDQTGPAYVRLDNLEGRWFDVGPDTVRAVGERIHLLSDAEGNTATGESDATADLGQADEPGDYV